MRPYKKIFFLILLTAYLLSPPSYGETENFFSDNDKSISAPVKYVLNNNKIYIEDRVSRELGLEGEFLGINSDRGILYYIKESEDGWLAGNYNRGEGKISEYTLGNRFRKLYKLECRDNVFYFLAGCLQEQVPENSEGEMNSRGDDKVLVRFDPENNDKKIIKEVEDFTFAGGRLVAVKENGLDCNGAVIPLTLSGKRYIDRVIDNRFIFLTNGIEVEVIDILSERNIYLYRDGKAFPYNPDYNIILEFNDTVLRIDPVTDPDNMIYYQISINGFDSGRTETAPPGVSRNSMLKAETGRYCLIKAERWELDKIKGRYVRVNNIYQPDEIKLYIPDNRIIKIRFDFNGERYIMNQSVYDN